MKIAHFSDCHITGPFKLTNFHSIFTKRLTGTFNVYTKRSHILKDAEKKLYATLKHIIQKHPDMVLFSGDISSLSLKSEFLRAREIIYNTISHEKLFLIPGNHDRYTFLTSKTDLFHRIFTSEYDYLSYPYPKIRFLNNGTLLLSLNTARFNPLFFDASGFVKKSEILHAQTIIDKTPENRGILLIMHHSIYKKNENVDTYYHRIRNYQEILRFIKKNNIKAVLSGHIHKAYIHYDKYNQFTQYNPGPTLLNNENNQGYFLYRLTNNGDIELLPV